MKSLASVCALLIGGTVTAQEPPPGDGPRGTSQETAGQARYDAVGRVSTGSGGGPTLTTDALPAGSFAEVTSLNSGRTVIVAVEHGAVPAGAIAVLSEAAAAALGIDERSAAQVRVRGAVASPQETAAIRIGGAVPTRADAPPALLAALRRKITPVTQATPQRRTLKAPASAKPAVRAGFLVQVAAVSDARRARDVATELGGSVLAGPPRWRVRLGPYATSAEAARIRTDMIRRGYAAAQIIRYP